LLAVLPVDKKKSFGVVTTKNVVACLLEGNTNVVYKTTQLTQELTQVADAGSTSY
jgi:hypothetical protein